jgi:hypothetical protein
MEKNDNQTCYRVPGFRLAVDDDEVHKIEKSGLEACYEPDTKQEPPDTVIFTDLFIGEC